MNDLDSALLYRVAFGLAADLAEARRHDHGSGRARDGDGGAATIEAEAARRLGADDPGRLALVRRGVADALAGRKPCW